MTHRVSVFPDTLERMLHVCFHPELEPTCASTICYWLTLVRIDCIVRNILQSSLEKWEFLLMVDLHGQRMRTSEVMLRQLIG